MSYAAIQTGYATVIKKIAGYDATNVLENDRRVLGHGETVMVVLLPGPFRQVEATLKGQNTIVWTTFIDLFVLYKGEANTTIALLIAERQKIIDEINKWPHLDGVAGSDDAIARAGGDIGKVENTQIHTFRMVGETTEYVGFTRSE